MEKKLVFATASMGIMLVSFFLSCDVETLENRKIHDSRREEKSFRPLHARETSTPPKIDGRLSESCWLGIEKDISFVGIGKGKPKHSTFARIAYDKEKLYIGFLCKESEMNKIRGEIKVRDGDVWTDDCVEIFLNPEPESKKYYHFILNVNGTQYDALSEFSGSSNLWNACWESAVFKGKDFWSVEIAIPFKELKLTAPSVKDFWIVNLCRENSRNNEYPSYFRVFDGFHSHTVLDMLLFGGTIQDYMRAKIKCLQKLVLMGKSGRTAEKAEKLTQKAEKDFKELKRKVDAGSIPPDETFYNLYELCKKMLNIAQVGRWIDPRLTELPLTRTGFIQLSDGRLMAIEDNGVITSKDGGRTWSKPQKIYDGPKPGIPGTGPLLKTHDGVIVLVYADSSTFTHKYWDAATREFLDGARLDVWSIRSLDGGRTWVDRQQILDGFCGTALDIIQTRSGHIVVPVMDIKHNPPRHVQYTFVSADNGKTWKQSNVIDLRGNGDHDGAMEGTVAELSDGRVLMLIRTTLDRFWEAYSDDHGLSWRIIQPSQIDASSAPGYLTRLTSGRLVLVWNRLYPEGKNDFIRKAGHYSERPATWHREELSIAFSKDDGKTWTEPVVIARDKDKFISYPYILERKPGELWITTRYNRPNGTVPVCVSLMEKDFVGEER